MAEISAFALRPFESAADGIRRIVRDRAERAIEHLAGARENLVSSVHESRKRFKEVRAALRLVRAALGERQFTVENRWFRDAGRELAAMRDAHATLQAWEKLSEVVKQDLDRRTARKIRLLLEKRAKTVEGDSAERFATIEAVLTRVKIAAERVASWELEGDFDVIAGGLRRTYGDGRSRFRALRHLVNDAAVHNWRKRVKDQWYHTLMLREVVPEEFEARAGKLEKLSKLLGDHHDLAVIRELVGMSELIRGAAELSAISAHLGDRQRDLEERAFPLGDDLFSEKPADFLASVESNWELWRERSSIEEEARLLAATA